MTVYYITWDGDSFYSLDPFDKPAMSKEVELSDVPLEDLFVLFDEFVRDEALSSAMGFPEYLFNCIKSICGEQKAERVLRTMFNEKGFEWVL